MSQSGIVLVDKPSGISSAQVVSKIKRIFGGKIKVGHAGTLDPLATGLLVCLIGEATKVASYAEAGVKIYSGTMRFGLTTDTDDITGEKINNDLPLPEAKVVFTEAEKFIGPIDQIPPRVSAIKIDGERSYNLVREGKEVELKSRAVHVYELSLKQISESDYSFYVKCSKGTYIRSICRDLGGACGSGAVLTTLRREGSYPFFVDEAGKLEDIEPETVLPISKLILKQVILPSKLVKDLKGGKQEGENGRLLQSLMSGNNIDEGPILYYDEGSTQNPVGILIKNNELWRIGVNFN